MKIKIQRSAIEKALKDIWASADINPLPFSAFPETLEIDVNECSVPCDGHRVAPTPPKIREIPVGSIRGRWEKHDLETGTVAGGDDTIKSITAVGQGLNELIRRENLRNGYTD